MSTPFSTSTLFKRIAGAGLVALTIGSATLATTTEASARNGRHGALFGGLAAGALLGGVLANSGAYAGPAYGAPVYGEPAYAPPVYGRPATIYDEEPAYAPVCHRERQPVFDSWGDFRGYRHVRVCD